MDDELLKKYRKYASTTEAFAVLLVKKHLAEAKGHWVDVGDCERYEMSEDNLHFRFVTGGLYKRRIQPKYPAKSAFTVNGVFDERRYYFMARAITWEAAHKDIEQQKSKKVKAKSFKVAGISYDKNRGNNNFFRSDAPAEIKALAKNLSDRTDPLWDKAMDYVNEPEFVYKIKQACLV
ncbi:hypothetical protein [Colwellia sp. Bg11-12]|uniref:hypothetical protein n=1 Tax=Colwellia sp. Bg11-12 TaxID=2759817 RepID=UPI0015F584C3|nr:hypothetical protein [Colwellia sp. Bg11-12]MBA6262310.1 hypothetical protein [Colwellia sp. Bg11-12]